MSTTTIIREVKFLNGLAKLTAVTISTTGVCDDHTIAYPEYVIANKNSIRRCAKELSKSPTIVNSLFALWNLKDNMLQL